MYIIVIKLPDGINYYVGKCDIYGNYWKPGAGYKFDGWNLDIKFALKFSDKLECRKTLSELQKAKGQKHAKMKHSTIFINNN